MTAFVGFVIWLVLITTDAGVSALLSSLYVKCEASQKEGDGQGKQTKDTKAGENAE